MSEDWLLVDANLPVTADAFLCSFVCLARKIWLTANLAGIQGSRMMCFRSIDELQLQASLTFWGYAYYRGAIYLIMMYSAKLLPLLDDLPNLLLWYYWEPFLYPSWISTWTRFLGYIWWSPHNPTSQLAPKNHESDHTPSAPDTKAFQSWSDLSKKTW